MTYELWSGESGNLVGSFESAELALDAVRRAADRNGPEYVEGLALIEEDDSGDSRLLAEGPELLGTVQASPSSRRR